MSEHTNSIGQVRSEPLQGNH